MRYVRWFGELSKHDLELVGGKGANLGELIRAGVCVPPGFVVTTIAYNDFLTENNLRPRIHKLLATCDANRPDQLNDCARRIQSLILRARISQELTLEVFTSYDKLAREHGDGVVAVRSSATAEDLPEASFAGQQSSFLNVAGDANVLMKIKECWASLFEPRSIFYRTQKGYDHFKVGIAVPVQQMVQSEVSGVMFTIDPVTQNKNQMVIEAVYGLGDYIVGGVVTPDHYEVDKRQGLIISKQVSRQEIMEVQGPRGVKSYPVPAGKQNLQKLPDKYILELAHTGGLIQKHYYFPQDIEWALANGRLYIIQSRPVTALGKKRLDESVKTAGRSPVLKGAGAAPGVAWGQVRIIEEIGLVGKLKAGEVLVTHMTTPDFVPAMKKAAAIVTDEGGLTSHAAIISRELGVPCVVGTISATKVLKTGQAVTVNGSTGEIFWGAADAGAKILHTEERSLRGDIKTATKVYVNLAEPELAAATAKRTVDGVGLLRAEFMMAQMEVHPRKAIADGKQKNYVDELTKGLLSFAQAFYPRPVIYRASDFRTNEYRGLKGGDRYEPVEANPMMGLRGAFRYICDPTVFELELTAIRAVRNTRRLNNLHLMIPFVRTPQEMLEVRKLVVGSGLVRGTSFWLWMMVEVPSNVIRLEEFIDVGIDGVSIGTNDLTMLMLGVDRDSSEVSREYNEQDPAVLWAIEKTVRTCVKRGISSSLCGQAASQYPDLVERLVKWGITSLSVNPDAIERTREIVYDCEQKAIRHDHDF